MYYPLNLTAVFHAKFVFRPRLHIFSSLSSISLNTNATVRYSHELIYLFLMNNVNLPRIYNIFGNYFSSDWIWNCQVKYLDCYIFVKCELLLLKLNIAPYDFNVCFLDVNIHLFGPGIPGEKTCSSFQLMLSCVIACLLIFICLNINVPI